MIYWQDKGVINCGLEVILKQSTCEFASFTFLTVDFVDFNLLLFFKIMDSYVLEHLVFNYLMSIYINFIINDIKK